MTVTDQSEEPRKRNAFEITEETLMIRYGTLDPEALRVLGANFVEIGAAKNLIRWKNDELTWQRTGEN